VRVYAGEKVARVKHKRLNITDQPIFA